MSPLLLVSVFAALLSIVVPVLFKEVLVPALQKSKFTGLDARYSEKFLSVHFFDLAIPSYQAVILPLKT